MEPPRNIRKSVVLHSVGDSPCGEDEAQVTCFHGVKASIWKELRHSNQHVQLSSMK